MFLFQILFIELSSGNSNSALVIDPLAHKLSVPKQPGASDSSSVTGQRGQGSSSSPSKSAAKGASVIASPEKKSSSPDRKSIPSAGKSKVAGETATAAVSANQAADAAARALLGELYVDKEYLQKLSEDKGIKSLFYKLLW